MRSPPGALLLLPLALSLAAPGKPIVVKDPPCGYAPLAAADCTLLRATPGPEGLAVEATLGAPLDRGMFTCVHVYVDADGNPETGLGGGTGPGKELWFRAVVGSRFRPNDAPPVAGVPAPLSLARLSWSLAGTQEQLTGTRTSPVWTNRELPGRPEVDGARISFTIPDSLLVRANRGYAADYSFEVDVETSCADQPLFLEYRGADDGLPIAVDGDDRDWSGEPEAADPGGELFAALRCLDLVRLRADHDGRRLLACVDAELPGFGDRLPPTGDVAVSQSITVVAEPLDAGYERPRRVRVPRGVPRGTTPEHEYAAKGRTLEVALPRTGLDGRVRVLAWSESVHHDRVPDTGSLRASTGGR